MSIVKKRFEVHIRATAVEPEFEGAVAGIVCPTEFDTIEEARVYLQKMLQKVEVKIWDSKELKFVAEEV